MTGSRDDHGSSAGTGDGPRDRDLEHTVSISPGGAASSRGRQGPALPETIGGYRIVGVLGEGGMGVVYEAEQRHPHRRVALKVMRRGHRVDEVHARLFQREAEILGRLKHPNIAAIYESGHTVDGHDFFAMELVRGETLDAWLAARPARLSTEELELRLGLFRAIADGVHYAHQRGVIHRDLKPTNIIVRRPEETVSHGSTAVGVPVVKILDFGLARITDHDAGGSLLTEVGQLKGTVPYMSPEQAAGRPDEIDVRTDVYALGVILYEMLAGRRPYDTGRAALVEALRVVCEEPPRPLRESAPGARRIDADVETIVAKALEKVPSRRYPSVAAMAEDVERFLTSQPILARPPSALYQLRKFARRHRVIVGSAAAAMLVLVAFAATMTVQAERIRQEADRANREAAAAREVSDFLISLFDRSDPGVAMGEDPTASELLQAGAERIDALADQPATQAAFMETIGRVYTVLGRIDRAEPLLERSLAIRETHSGRDALALATGLQRVAELRDVAGRYDDAEPLIRRAVEILERAPGDGPELASSLNVLGNVLWHQGRMEDAEAVHRRALEMRERTLAGDHPELAASLHNLGALRYLAGDLAEAERLYRRSIEIEEAAHGPDGYQLATSLHTLAIVYQDQQRFEEALALERRALAIRERVLGPDHWHVALSLTTLGNIQRELGRPATAEPLIRRAIEVAEAVWGPEHGEVWWMRRSLVRTLLALERLDAAGRQLDALEELAVRAASPTDLASVLELRGELAGRRGRYDEAEDHYRRAARVLADLDPDDPFIGLALAGLARIQRDAGRPAAARATFREAIERMEAGWGPDDPDLRQARDELARLPP